MNPAQPPLAGQQSAEQPPAEEQSAERPAAQLSDLDRLRHSAAHVMADAVKRLFPAAKVTIGPPIEQGFYYDFDVPEPFTDADLARIEQEMGTIIAADHPFELREVARDEAHRLFASLGEDYKLELLDAIPAGQPVTVCQHGAFVDLCRGGHVASTGLLKAVKLTGVAGAYWRGDEHNKMLQRIYGTAFFEPAELERHLALLEEAKRRDHRRLGRELDLFSINETIGPGLVLWHPRGALVRHQLETFWRQEHLAAGYQLVYTPHLARETLWRQSGHLDFYSENMYAGMDIDGQQYLVKPMNCPFHVMIYKHALRSYRELPLRWAELGTVYRYERTGVLHGLFRVRGFTQDDAHLYVRRDQLAQEIDRVIDFCLRMLRAFGFQEFELYLSTRPAHFVGTAEEWDEAEGILRRSLEASGVPFQVDRGGGVFYGPKIDLKIKDSLGRRWQCSTVQVDFQLPERFDMTYVGEDGGRQHRPIMIHRALLGSIERFFGILVEHYGGAFPVWMAPVQATVLNVNGAQAAYAAEVRDALRAAGLRAEADLRNEKLGAKIRDAQLQKVPYMLVVGDREASAGLVAPRPRQGQALPAQPLAEFVDKLRLEGQIPRA
ncbi:MAG: threonine--tRNA ligase [Proteobacteria bacterium]|nr:threonine--tRNA ligase [Pseudomonadota bacterium]